MSAPFLLGDATPKSGIFYLLVGTACPVVRGPFVISRPSRDPAHRVVRLASNPKAAEQLYGVKTKCYAAWADATDAAAALWDEQAVYASERAAALRGAAKADGCSALRFGGGA